MCSPTISIPNFRDKVHDVSQKPHFFCSNSDPADASPSRNDLITEAEIRENLGPRVLGELIDHRRHSETDDGTCYWVRTDCEDLLGAIEAWKGVTS